MRIATWNVNGLRSRLDFVRLWLRERRPDLVGLQEIKATEDQFPFEEFEAEGYRAELHLQKAWNGVAVLAKEPLEVTQRGLPGEDAMGARLLAAQTRGIHFVTIYVPNGKTVEHEDFPSKLQWLGSLRRYLEDHHRPNDPVVLCGDFNLCPTELDTWHEDPTRIFHTPEERRLFRGLEEWGFTDLFRRHHPDAREYSWWDYRGGAFHRRQGLRIDFLLGTASVADRIESVEIDRDYRKKRDGLTPSDHAPVLADLDDR
ncbi:MAG: exodeoxyribonuclease III [Planctomycetes bacterium]|nr:exodeoxyribonuclease III [Planctomycetota bacterium]